MSPNEQEVTAISGPGGIAHLVPDGCHGSNTVSLHIRLSDLANKNEISG